MENIDKVIKTIEERLDEANPWKEMPPLHCDVRFALLEEILDLLNSYKELQERHKILVEKSDDMYAMLKEQKAHILAIEELWNTEVVWLERRDKKYVKAALPFIDAQDDTYLFNTSLGEIELLPHLYRHTWIAWSARPTEEQRRAVKWE